MQANVDINDWIIIGIVWKCDHKLKKHVRDHATE